MEVRSVAGEVLNAEAGMSPEEALQRFPLVRGGVVQQNQDRSPEMPQQLTQEPADLLLPDVVKKEEIVEAQPMALGLTGIPEMTEILSRRPWR
jgi:hypothetical protein